GGHAEHQHEIERGEQRELDGGRARAAGGEAVEEKRDRALHASINAAETFRIVQRRMQPKGEWRLQSVAPRGGGAAVSRDGGPARGAPALPPRAAGSARRQACRGRASPPVP